MYILATNVASQLARPARRAINTWPFSHAETLRTLAGEWCSGLAAGLYLGRHGSFRSCAGGTARPERRSRSAGSERAQRLWLGRDFEKVGSSLGLLFSPIRLAFAFKMAGGRIRSIPPSFVEFNRANADRAAIFRIASAAHGRPAPTRNAGHKRPRKSASALRRDQSALRTSGHGCARTSGHGLPLPEPIAADNARAAGAKLRPFRISAGASFSRTGRSNTPSISGDTTHDARAPIARPDTATHYRDRRRGRISRPFPFFQAVQASPGSESAPLSRAPGSSYGLISLDWLLPSIGPEGSEKTAAAPCIAGLRTLTLTSCPLIGLARVTLIPSFMSFAKIMQG